MTAFRTKRPNQAMQLTAVSFAINVSDDFDASTPARAPSPPQLILCLVRRLGSGRFRRERAPIRPGTLIGSRWFVPLAAPVTLVSCAPVRQREHGCGPDFPLRGLSCHASAVLPRFSRALIPRSFCGYAPSRSDAASATSPLRATSAT